MKFCLNSCQQKCNWFKLESPLWFVWLAGFFVFNGVVVSLAVFICYITSIFYVSFNSQHPTIWDLWNQSANVIYPIAFVSAIISATLVSMSIRYYRNHIPTAVVAPVVVVVTIDNSIEETIHHASYSPSHSIYSSVVIKHI
jgi:hypothetical protein